MRVLISRNVGGQLAVAFLLLRQVLMTMQVVRGQAMFQDVARNGGYLHVMLASSLADTIWVVLLVGIWIVGTVILTALAYVTRGGRS